MKVVHFTISFVITVAMIIALSTSFDKIPAFGKFLSPQHGFWQNAAPVDADASSELQVSGLTSTVRVYFDNRMVPHIFADNEADAYYVQGYLHAKFRLWQMEFQTIAAAGRLSEILGVGTDSAYLNNDIKMRRMGMVYGAQRSLQEMEKDAKTLAQINAYTKGVNSYIENITSARLPLEYRLLSYTPEKWTNLKTALLLKYLSLDLTGTESDIENTNALSFFSKEDFDKLYPLMQDSAIPVVPKGMLYEEPSLTIQQPANADSLYFRWSQPVDVAPAAIDEDNGSNNWAVGGSKTASGRPILCNDPHLGLNLPALWYEVQITTPEFSVYGVSLPGSPAVVIGFNDSIAWGVTSASRDVLDFYRIQFRDGSRSEYRFNGEWLPAELKADTFRIKGGDIFVDTVRYTVFGPIMYDRNYNGRGRAAAGMDLAIRWKAHDPSNEFKTFYLLNKANNIRDFETAIGNFECPGQNFVFASKTGDIAIWHQGKFPAKWYRQGDFVMPGTDSSYSWKADIPQAENPHEINPDRGFVSSANQIPADTSYPYYLGTGYDVFRGLTINRQLAGMQQVGIADMQNLQNENYNAFAETALSVLVPNTVVDSLSPSERRYFTAVKVWNRENDPGETGPTIFALWIDALDQLVFNDEFEKITGSVKLPASTVLIEQLGKDSAFSFVDDISTPSGETTREVVTAAFKKACTTLMFLEKDGRLAWSRFKDAGIRHLLRMEQLSRFHLTTGGGVHVVNATKQFHGPSWKMVVHLTDEVEAYGIYPGGQDGNPGNKAYDEFVDDWAAGKYYNLWMMKSNESNDRRVKASLTFEPRKQ